MAVFSVVVLIVTGLYWNIVRIGSDNINGNTVEAVGGHDLITAQASVDPPTAGADAPAAVYEPENFLLVGSDTRAGGNDIDGGAATLGDDANTDSMIVLHISGDRQHFYAVSLPRDMWAPNVPCQRFHPDTKTYDGTADGQQYTRLHINAFYGVGGPKCLVDAVENLTQLPITGYLQIDFSGFQTMVDALGGVTINACGPIIDETLQTILPNGGEQLINGAQALSLARARKVIGDPSSDLSRIHRQQLILSAILREVKSAGTLLDPAKLGRFVTALTDNTTPSGVDFNSLMDLAGSIGNVDPSRVTFYTLPTVADPSDDTDRGSLLIDPDAAKPLLDALRNDQPIPGSEPVLDTPAPSTSPTAAATLTVAAGTVNLEIVNATGTAGAAGQAAEALNAVGFNVPDDRLDTSDDTQTGLTVQYSPGNEATALTVVAAVPGATLEPIPDLGNHITLRLGTAWAGEVEPVSVGDPISTDLLTQIPNGSASNVITPDDTPASTSTPSVNAADTTCL